MAEYTNGDSLLLDELDPTTVLASGVSDTVDATAYAAIARFLPTNQQDDDGREWACKGTAEGNARLFLAAAELLAACEQAEDCIDPTVMGGQLALEMVRAAIAKARGA